MNTNTLHRKILGWYDFNKRNLPWRINKDPYRIWISEIMLQQTRVETVIPYYERFLSHFPTVESLAEAEEDTLLNLWAGLGYYSRAKNLKLAAIEIINQFNGSFPHTLMDLRSLKGIGPYTAAAIASIAFDKPHAAVDGNLERVFSRLLALRLNPKKEGRSEIDRVGESLVKLGRAGDLNQAFMDLSSGICLPKEPRCETCPIASECRAREEGSQRDIPLRPIKMAPVELSAEGLILIAEEEILLARRAKGAWLSGMWDIPWWILEDGREFTHSIKGNEFSIHESKRTITKHKIHFRVRSIACDKKVDERSLRTLPAPAAEFRWVRLSELHGLNLPRPSEKALESSLARLK